MQPIHLRGCLTPNSAIKDLQNIRDSAHPFRVCVVHSWLYIQCVTKKGRQDSAAHERALAHTHLSPGVRSHAWEPVCTVPFFLREVQKHTKLIHDNRDQNSDDPWKEV